MASVRPEMHRIGLIPLAQLSQLGRFIGTSLSRAPSL